MAGGSPKAHGYGWLGGSPLPQQLAEGTEKHEEHRTHGVQQIALQGVNSAAAGETPGIRWESKEGLGKSEIHQLMLNHGWLSWLVDG